MDYSRRILLFSFLNLGIMSAAVAFYWLVPVYSVLFLPMVSTALALALAPLAAGPALILTYVAFDGMLKVLSNYNPILHIGSDLLVLLLVCRWLVAIRYSPRPSVKYPPFLFVFFLHLFWVTIEIFNPYGLGIIPGIASYKIYATFLTLYFVAYVSLEHPGELRAIMSVAVAILCIEIALSIYQFSGGIGSVTRLSPNYSKAVQGIFEGLYFRPFGTASTPGGVSTWFFLSMPLLAALIAWTPSYSKKLAGVGLIALTAYSLFICQVRASFIKGGVSLALVFIILYWRNPLRLFTTMVIVAVFILTVAGSVQIKDPTLEVAKQRFLALTDLSTITSARGNGVWESISYIWQNAPLGIGPSRVGAAANVFKGQIQANRFYGSEWSFADNLYRALTVELGVPGLLFYLCFVFGPVSLIFLRLWRNGGSETEARYLSAGCLSLALTCIIGQWGTEGGLYLPECAYFWIFVGAAMKMTEPRFLGYRREF